MPYLVGMDEAGYGPNLGPLVVSASVWWISDGDDRDPYELLADAVTRGHDAAGPRRNARCAKDDRLVIADSKQVYKSGDSAAGLGALEHGVLSVLELLAHSPRAWSAVWQSLAGDGGAHRQAEPWYAEFDRPLPLSGNAEPIAMSAARLRTAAEACGARCCALRSRAVFPDEFNALCDQHGSKGIALTRVTLQLLAEVLVPLSDQRVQVVCDKHGGRNFYAAQLMEFVTADLVETVIESSARSVYRFGPAASRIEVSFRVGGEESLPVALASMTAKYLRELAMLSFNEFWCARVPGLRPTAGYPGDARRFKDSIATAQAELAIEDRRLWRNR
ncbi:MAG: hypothetical protein K8T25_20830 [Planctomycetia bacterium]|nr:hypothetical protein [Planctomycetia bacterium]